MKTDQLLSTDIATRTADSQQLAWYTVGGYSAFALSVVIFGIGLNQASAPLTLVALLVILVTAIAWSFRQISQRFIFVAFISCFFVFLISRPTISLFFDAPESPARQTLGTNFSSERLQIDILSCLYLAAAGLLIGAALVAPRFKKQTLEAYDSGQAPWIRSVRFWSLVLFFSTMPFQALVLLDVSSTVATSGFYENRVQAVSGLPSIVHIIAGMFDVGFFVFLATRPSKRAASIPILAYVALAALSLATWQRSSFILSIVFVLMYLVHRHGTDAEATKWITARFVAITTLAAIPLGALMLSIGNLRGRQGQASEYPLFGFLDFLYGQGISINVVGYAIALEDRVADNKFYSFGPLIEFFKWNVGSLLTGAEAPVGQNAVRAIEGHQFAHAISYAVMPDVYLSGSGYGSSFVAELWTDFGPMGILIGSMALGAFLMWLPRVLSSRNLLLATVGLMVMREIMFVPRASLVQFLVSPFETSNLVAGVLLTILVLLTTRRASKARE